MTTANRTWKFTGRGSEQTILCTRDKAHQFALRSGLSCDDLGDPEHDDPPELKPYARIGINALCEARRVYAQWRDCVKQFRKMIPLESFLRVNLPPAMGGDDWRTP